MPVSLVPAKGSTWYFPTMTAIIRSMWMATPKAALIRKYPTINPAAASFITSTAIINKI